MSAQLSVSRTMLGAAVEKDGTHFRVWAPAARAVEVVLAHEPHAPIPLGAAPDGYFDGFVRGVGAGARYRYRLDGDRVLPDPASRFQPEGVHGPSEVIDPSSFEWTDGAWGGIAPDRLVIYELHVGTFSERGTFDGVRDRLASIVELGATAVELMPVGAFAGERNWGYDGVDLFAPARAYGRPDDLRRLVNAAHGLGLAVILDVVYNHLGPEGAYLGAFSPSYFTDRHRTPWGSAVNLDGPGSREVRRFFVENARHWVREYHVDGLRLDATHALIDDSTPHFLQELSERLRAERHDVVLIAEDERRLAELIRPAARGGWDLDACWSDDFHHHVRRLLAGDSEGYYAPYTGRTDDLALTIERGWWMRRSHDGVLQYARDAAGRDREPAARFVFCLQNHDQIGNRAFGGRLHHEIDAAPFRAATALLILAPETPLIFMGQEWAATTPFLYFTDLPEPLGRSVTVGRREEFAAFSAFADPALRAAIPDPQAAATFDASRLRWDERGRPPHDAVLRLYRRLLELRRAHPALQPGGRCLVRAVDADTIVMRRDTRDASLTAVVRLRGAGDVSLDGELALPSPSSPAVLSTEDAPFTAAPRPIVVAADGDRVGLSFARPGAVVFS